MAPIPVPPAPPSHMAAMHQMAPMLHQIGLRLKQMQSQRGQAMPPPNHVSPGPLNYMPQGAVSPTGAQPINQVDPGFDYGNWATTEPQAAAPDPLAGQVDPGFDPGNWATTEPHTGAVDGGYDWGSRSFPKPQPVPFNQMRQALTDKTKSGIQSHQEALVRRFLQNRGQK